MVTKKELSEALNKLQKRVTDLESDFQDHMSLHEKLRAITFQQAHTRADAMKELKQKGRSPF